MRHAQLLLPSPLGLLEYDVLEDSVFVGPGARDGLRAQDTPFPEALVALTRKPDGFWVRPLPDAPQPEVNGETTDGKRLEDGDRIRLAGKTALFRTQSDATTKKSAPPPPPREAAQRLTRPTEERNAPAPSRGIATALKLVGAGLILFATVKALNFALTLGDAKKTKSYDIALDEHASAAPKETSAYREYKRFVQLADRQRNDPGQILRAATSYLELHPESRYADAVIDRMRTANSALAKATRRELNQQVESLRALRQYRESLEAIHRFQEAHGASEAAVGVDDLLSEVEQEAKRYADDVRSRAASMIVRSPRQAYQLLLAAGLQLPPDLHATLLPLLERASLRVVTKEAESPRVPPKDTPPTRTPDRPRPPKEPSPGTTDPDKPTPNAANPGTSREDQVRAAWRRARLQLLAGHYDIALESYTSLLKKYAQSETVKMHGFQIRNGEKAARAGLMGSTGLLRAPSKAKDPTIDVTYNMADKALAESDWRLEQPFASHLALKGGHVKNGMRLRGATGLFLNVVFDPDVIVEATIRAETATDFGAMALENSTSYRAVLFNINNKDFQLKKGAASRKEPGHVLWYIGQGVWADADADAHGFIKLDAASKVSIKHGDRVTIRFARKKHQCTASFQGKTDKASVKGTVKGDNDSTMGPARIGFFTSGGDITVESVRVRGRVNSEWFENELVRLIDGDPGPDE